MILIDQSVRQRLICVRFAPKPNLYKPISLSQPQCASLRITDCAQLAREWPRDVILRDDVCSAQCGLVLQNGGPQGRQLPINLRGQNSQRVSRSRVVQQQTSVPISFQGFQFPDLTQFIG